MITKSPYGFGPEIRAYRIGTEPEPSKPEFIRKPDPQPAIDRCLTCKKAAAQCSGNCNFDEDGSQKPTAYARYKERLREQWHRLAEEEDHKEAIRAKQVARMVLDDRNEEEIAAEMGLPVKEVRFLIKQARRKGYLN